MSGGESKSKNHRGPLIYPSLSVAGIAALLALWLPVVFTRQSEIIGGVRYWWLVDDAMISMRYARNLAEGSGLVWNVGERVEGYTNLLWTLFMTLVHLTPLPDSKTSLAVLLANVAIGAATVPLIVRLVRLLDGGTSNLTNLYYFLNYALIAGPAWTRPHPPAGETERRVPGALRSTLR
jgi:hypothetical protein